MTEASLLRLPPAPASIQKGVPLTGLLGPAAIECLAHNVHVAWGRFNTASFIKDALAGLDGLSILRRGEHLAVALQRHLPPLYEEAIGVLVRSLTPPLSETDSLGLSGFFYLPHVSFVARYGLDTRHNGGRDPFEISMRAQYELTRRFSAEFSMRPFLIQWPERTLARLTKWTGDPDVHVRRLCSEGSRPRLPWAIRIPAFIEDPTPTLPLLEALKDDADLYVRRSVANHVGDIAKDHPTLAFDLCENWLCGASKERKWVIRHALRHPGKKGDARARNLRELARS